MVASLGNSKISWDTVELIPLAALFYYDWIIMLPVEIQEVWSKKLSASSLLYFFARYFNILDWALFAVLTFVPGSPRVSHLICCLNIRVYY